MSLKKISINKIPSYGAYSTCVLVHNFLFISGQIGINMNENFKKKNSNSIEIETKKIMNNLKIILLENRMNFQNIVKTTIFLIDIQQIQKVNQIYSNFFKNKEYPSREIIEASALPKNANIEISMIAYKSKL
ncbi:RidA family protein [Blattabacterium cuenoti]|uniref:RidA family protein n=1 Tax=Blattabacterium cuenoti TaxID=1653831 RepID=UPI00163C0DA5|nr:Rid family detoxifying hydrolase [Blattabacterium cuenoti]